MRRVHVGLDFKHECAEPLRIRLDHALLRQSRRWGWREFQKLFEERPHAEVGQGAAEIHRTQFPLPHGFGIKRIPGHIQQFNVMAKLRVDVGRQLAGKTFIVQITDFGFENIAAMRTVGFKQFDLL